MSTPNASHRLTTEDLAALVRDIPDFPRPGVLFKDITPLLRDPRALATVIDLLCERIRPLDADLVVAAEARGFLIGPALARELGIGFAPVRKPGKLPYDTRTVEYELEYGTDSLQIHSDGVVDGERVLLVDDVLATGGTMAAKAQLVEVLGGTVAGCAVIIELGFLRGREKLSGYPVESLIEF